MKLDLGKLKKLFRRKRKVLGHRNPHHDWLMILELTAFLFVLIVGLGAFLYIGIDKGLIFSNVSTTETKTPTIDRSTITSISSYYQDKETTLQILRANPNTVVDPSL